MKKIRSIRDLDVKGKRVLVRVDFNVPMTKEGSIADETRIRAAVPTLKYLLERGATLILMSHLGRPKGPDPKLSLRPCCAALSRYLNQPIFFAEAAVGPIAETSVEALPPGKVLLLENLRFYKGEEAPDQDPEFVQRLASLGDIYVNDAFGTAHRAHASTCQIAALFPNQCAIGFLIEKELEFLQTALLEPKHPFAAILGGSKVSSKIGVITALLEKIDRLFIGGAMAFTFMKAQNISVGSSPVEADMLAKADLIMNLAHKKSIPIFLPEDYVISKTIDGKSPVETISALKGIPEGYYGVDIGQKTVQAWSNGLKGAETIIWNGPVGIFEIPAFAQGTFELARIIAGHKQAITIVGGGDSVAAIEQLKLQDAFSHVSTGGGASLELIEFGTLPGIEAIAENKTGD